MAVLHFTRAKVSLDPKYHGQNYGQRSYFYGAELPVDLSALYSIFPYIWLAAEVTFYPPPDRTKMTIWPDHVDNWLWANDQQQAKAE